ncbi:MAG: DUF3710 domain-containing protein [Bifidobacterium aquikefiri]|uniref:DUF3710 domain-containing protein n=1 Tax=Bifidobacterium aquikefiri TaxID=1653207 RepID=A0A261G5K3_9BIFI|nr:DUF3710 domain-containing protein [Bifidobacterium aquikefiri]OZG66709.1 hypothetical protein BAQU_0781 [Bifidobacterium aquikefiri]
MGLFGFGKKHAKQQSAEDQPEVENDEVLAPQDEDADFDPIDDDNQEDSAEYQGRGEDRGPWDVDDEEVVDYDEYLDIGAFYLPYLQGIELRLKANRASGDVLGATISYGSSSLEIEAFAAPKTLGLWDDVREDLLAGNDSASSKPGVFGTEVSLPVEVKGNTVITRIVGVDGPRWMLRGIFSGPAASVGEEKQILDNLFQEIVVERGDEPLAPRDMIPMHAPVTPKQRREQEAAAQDQDAATAKNTQKSGNDKNDKSIPEKPKGPFDSDQNTEVKTTLSRGPMFSEVR